MIDSLYHQGIFTPPVESEQSDVEASGQAELTKNFLLADSKMTIDTLQDAIDFEMANEEKKSVY
ncbi:tail fiber assembly protein [Cronobacter universalis]|nr:tail fiber assembly protein [Cronobacter universalis]MDI7660199.1 tail fiber assembly protein [Cronobacter universalis]